MARRVRQRSANIKVMVSQKTQEAESLKHYMVSRRKDDPCTHCTSKHLRHEPPKAHPREQLPTGLVQLETKDDHLNNQRCLYLDRTYISNPSDPIANIASLENMRLEILEKEHELIAINDA